VQKRNDFYFFIQERGKINRSLWNLHFENKNYLAEGADTVDRLVVLQSVHFFSLIQALGIQLVFVRPLIGFLSHWLFFSFESTFFSSISSLFYLLNNCNQYKLIEFSVPLAQSQSDWWAFRPGSITSIKNPWLYDFHCEFPFSFGFFASTCIMTEEYEFIIF
jgi:hypothetical protein